MVAKLLLAEKPGLKVIFTSGYSPNMAGKDISLVEGAKGFAYFSKWFNGKACCFIPIG